LNPYTYEITREKVTRRYRMYPRMGRKGTPTYSPNRPHPEQAYIIERVFYESVLVEVNYHVLGCQRQPAHAHRNFTHLVMIAAQKHSWGIEMFPTLTDPRWYWIVHLIDFPLDAKPINYPELCLTPVSDVIPLQWGPRYGVLLAKFSHWLLRYWPEKVFRPPGDRFLPSSAIPKDCRAYWKLILNPNDASTIVLDVAATRTIPLIRKKYLGPGRYKLPTLASNLKTWLWQQSKRRVLTDLGYRRKQKLTIGLHLDAVSHWEGKGAMSRPVEHHENFEDPYNYLGTIAPTMPTLPKFKNVVGVLRWFRSQCPWERIHHPTAFSPRWGDKTLKKPDTPAWMDFWTSVMMALHDARLTERDKQQIMAFLQNPERDLDRGVARKLGEIFSRRDIYDYRRDGGKEKK
jgi:hypothetical protein